MTLGSLVVLQTEQTIPPLAIGAIAFFLLLLMMGIVLSIGKGRPHA